MPDADFLLGLLEGIEIPDHNEVDACEVAFPCRDGWKVIVFYDVGELDYIDSFVSPTGEEIDFWLWPESEDKQRVMNWRGA